MPRKKKVEEPEMKCLTAQEMKKYDIFFYDLELAKHRAELLEARRRIHELNKENSELQMQLCGYKLHDEKQKRDKLKESHKKFDSGVRERLEIKQERFGFDPITGEISL